MWVGKHNRGGEGAENNVTKLDTAGWNGIAESKVILAKEVGEVVENDKEQAKNSSIEIALGLPEVAVFQEGMEELEEG